MSKKIIFICMLLLLGVTLIACGGSKAKGPTITDGNEVYLTVKQNGKTYSFNKEKVYDLLKNSYVISTLFSLVDKDLLQKEKVENVSYWDMVSEAEVAEAIEKATFPNGKTKLTPEQILELEVQFEEQNFTSGYRTQAEIENYHRLEIARKKYAQDLLEKAIIEKDEAAKDETEKYFPETKIQNKYNALHKDSYFAIVVKYNTVKEVNEALEQLGIKIEAKEANVLDSYAKWVWISDLTELTANEVSQAMIDLYNAQNSFKVANYPEDDLILVEGVHYTVEAGKIIFKTAVQTDTKDPLNELHFTEGKLTQINRGVLTQVKTNLVAYNPETSVVDGNQKWFTNSIQTLDSGKIQYLAMKLGTVTAPSLEDVKDEILEVLKQEVLTTDFINKQMTKMRGNYDIVIYDKEVEDFYQSQALEANVKFKKSKKTSKDIIAVVDGVNYTADQLFEIMNDKYGMNFISNQINYELLLNNKELNKVYDYTSNQAFDKNKILDKVAWDNFGVQIEQIKKEFAAGQYAGMGWENYINYVYQVKNEFELKLYLLYEDLGNKYIDKKYDPIDVEETADIWELYFYNMQTVVDKYYNVTGYHLLISVNDSQGTPTNPSDWTEYQKELAEELDSQVKVYLQNTSGKYNANFQDIVQAFAKAPRFVAKPGFELKPELTLVAYNLDNIEVSKFKSAGLSVKYEDLGSFENGKMVKAFSDAMVEIWNAANFTDGVDETTVLYGVDISEDKKIQSEFGYHVYVNTKATDIVKWKIPLQGEHVLPTYQQIKDYYIDKEAEHLTKEVKAAITKYFIPLRKELTGPTLTAIELVKEQIGLEIDLKNNGFTLEEFHRFLNINLEQLAEELVYKTEIPA